MELNLTVQYPEGIVVEEKPKQGRKIDRRRIWPPYMTTMSGF